MKKILSLMVALVLVSSLVLAANGEAQGIHEPGTGLENPELKEAGQGTGQGLEDGETLGAGQGQLTQTSAQAGETIQAKSQVKAKVHERLETGIANALTNVNNERAREVLQRNFERFQEKLQVRLERMENVEVEEVNDETGEVTITADEPVKWFGFIKGKANKRFDVDIEGNVNERARWYRFFYSENVVEETTEE